MITQAPGDPAAPIELERLSLAGCEIARVAVTDAGAARALGRLVAASPLPLVADVADDLSLGLAALDQGVAGLRINPGRLGRAPAYETLGRAAAAAGAVVRVGANAGSPSRAARSHPEGLLAGLVADTCETANRLADAGLSAIKLSVKTAQIPTLVAATRRLAAKTDWPLHLGLTEAGPLPDGEVKSAAAAAILLAEGLGDTLRISLTAEPVWEVQAAHRLLRALGLGQRGVDLVACPTCARCRGDVIDVARALRSRLDEGDPQSMWGKTLAVMGCPINGPGEARAADAGAAAAHGHWVLFSKGRVCGRVGQDEVVEALLHLAASSLDQ